MRLRKSKRSSRSGTRLSLSGKNTVLYRVVDAWLSYRVVGPVFEPLPGVEEDEVKLLDQLELGEEGELELVSEAELLLEEEGQLEVDDFELELERVELDGVELEGDELERVELDRKSTLLKSSHEIPSPMHYYA